LIIGGLVVVYREEYCEISFTGDFDENSMDPTPTRFVLESCPCLLLKI
jgi:hypothetical protein